jgi:membrane protease YdiL (CAAX protease family)
MDRRGMTFLDYAARGRNAGWRYVLALAAACVMAVVLGGVAAAVIGIAKILPDGWIIAAQDPSQPVVFFLFNGAIFGLLLLGLAIAARWVQGKRPMDLAGRWSWRLFGLGLVVWMLALTVAALVDFAIAPSGFDVTASSKTPQLALAALAGLGVQVLAEEYIFRGHITQGLLLALRKPIPTALLSGIIFGAVHIPNGLPQAASATIFGVLLALIAMRTHGIAFTTGLHLVNNVFGAVVVVSGGDVFRGSPGVFSQNTPQLMWWDTAVGSALLLVVTLVVLRIRWPEDPAAQKAA